MNMHAWINWFHTLAATLWLGGLCYMTILFIPLSKNIAAVQKATLTQVALGFRPLLFTAMAVIAGSGVWQIAQLGGMKSLPVLFHIKIALALVMVILTLLCTLVFLPRLATQLTAAGPNTPVEDDKLPGLLVSATALAALLGMAILGILAKIGIL
ncbi:MAG: hypothetical protein AB7P76_03235 [Candidatus Melainabacteria bacterium]